MDFFVEIKTNDLKSKYEADKIIKQQLVDAPAYLAENRNLSEEARFEKVQIKLKLFVNMIQSISQLFSIIRFRVPPFTLSIMNVFGAFNLNLSKLVNFGCHITYISGSYSQSYFNLVIVASFCLAITASYFSVTKLVRYR